MGKTNIDLLGVTEGTEIIDRTKENQHLKRLWEEYSKHSQVKKYSESQTK